jgi:limonene-1,2-epoxide hydrolase
VGIVVALLLIGAGVLFAVVYNANRSTPTKTLTAFCNALRGGDYQTAYNQLSSGLQAKYGSESAFAAAFSNNGGLGKVTGCTVSNVNDGAGKGTINYNLSGGSRLLVDYSLIDESGASKINAQSPRSSPALTLNTYCSALASADYQTAYNQFSKSLQGQVGTESQFADAATADKIKGCTVTSVNDAGATGTVTYLRSNGNKTSATDTLVNEQGTWKINAQQAISTPTETLLTYCDALEQKDYQSAYNQLSSNAQSQETESEFASNFKGITVTDCAVSNVNDTAGTGEITYTLDGTQAGTFDYTLVNEQSVWKIDTERKHS